MVKGPFGGPRPFASNNYKVEFVVSDPVLDVPTQDMIEREFASRASETLVFENKEIDGVMRGVGVMGADRGLSTNELESLGETFANIVEENIPVDTEVELLDVVVKDN